MANQTPTPEQEQEIDKIVAATSLPREIITEQVLSKNPVEPGTVVDAEKDPVGRAELAANELGDPPDQKRVVASTPEAQTKKALKGRKQDPLVE